MTRPFWPAVPVQAERDTVGLQLWELCPLGHFPPASSPPITSHPVPSLPLPSTRASQLHKHQGLAQVLDWDNLQFPKPPKSIKQKLHIVHEIF